LLVTLLKSSFCIGILTFPPPAVCLALSSEPILDRAPLLGGDDGELGLFSSDSEDFVVVSSFLGFVVV